jgi:hypothetical protein
VSALAIADSRHDDAMSAVHRALALDPDNSAAHNELARIQLRRHRAGNAVALARAASGFATAVRNDSRSTVSRQNLDLVIHVFLARTAYGIFLIAWIASRFRGNAEPAVLRVIPALLLVVPIGYAYRFIADLTPHLRAYLRRAIRHPVIGSAVACDALAASGLIVSAPGYPGGPGLFGGFRHTRTAALVVARSPRVSNHATSKEIPDPNRPAVVHRTDALRRDPRDPASPLELIRCHSQTSRARNWRRGWVHRHHVGDLPSPPMSCHVWPRSGSRLT